MFWYNINMLPSQSGTRFYLENMMMMTIWLGPQVLKAFPVLELWRLCIHFDDYNK